MKLHDRDHSAGQLHEKSFPRFVIEITVYVIAVALASATSLFAEKNYSTYCDNLCGDTTKCMFTCCTLTSETIGGVSLITDFHCSSTGCCAHPQDASKIGAGSIITVPLNAVAGVAGPIKCGLVATGELDPSSINVLSNDKAKTVTLSGTVKSVAQSRLAASVASKQAQGYKVINRLTIVPK